MSGILTVLHHAPRTVQLQRSTVIGDAHFITCLSSLLRMSYLKMLYWVTTIDRLHILQLVCTKEADHSTEDCPIVRPGYVLRYARMSRNRWAPLSSLDRDPWYAK